jgi:hypothetical protein
MGPGVVGWSHDGQFMVSRCTRLSVAYESKIDVRVKTFIPSCRNDNMPNGLWIWDTSRVGLSFIVVSINMIRTARWSPSENRLAWCSGTNKVKIIVP